MIKFVFDTMIKGRIIPIYEEKPGKNNLKGKDGKVGIKKRKPAPKKEASTR